MFSLYCSFVIAGRLGRHLTCPEIGPPYLSKLRMNPALIFSRVRFIFDRRNRDGPYVPRRPGAWPKTADEPGAHIFVLPFDIDHRNQASRHFETDHGRNCGTNPALGFESISFIA